MEVIDRTKAVTQYFLENSFKKLSIKRKWEQKNPKNTEICVFWVFVASWCCGVFCVVPCAGFCAGHFVVVPLGMTCLHCLQHSLFEHLFSLYYHLQHFCQCRVAVLKNRPVLAFYVVIYHLYKYRVLYSLWIS